MLKKKLSGALAFVLVASLLLPVIAFANVRFGGDHRYATNGHVTGSVYSDVYEVDGVTVHVYSPTGASLGVINAVYETVYEGTYIYRYNDTFGLYTWLDLALPSDGVTETVYQRVYSQPTDPGSGGGGVIFPPATFELDGTSGTISASALQNAFNVSSTVEITINEYLAIPAAGLVAAAEIEDALLVIIGEYGTYEIPLSVLDLDALATALDVEVDELTINIGIAQADDADAEAVADAVELAGATALSDAIEFTLEAEADDNTIAITNFGQTYVKRSINLNDAPSTTATVAVYDPANGTLRFVPSIVGNEIAEFQRTGNSIYIAIENEATFNDLPTNYWAQADIELLASKLVVEGTGGGRFEPEREINRAEFAALIVKALGLHVPAQVSDTYFSDINPTDWYAGYAVAAYEAGLINGYEDGEFKGDLNINREELTALIVRSLAFAGTDTTITAAQQTAALAGYIDSGDIVWATEEIATAVHLGLVLGTTETTLSARTDASRAESATLLKRLLQYVDFIE